MTLRTSALLFSCSLLFSMKSYPLAFLIPSTTGRQPSAVSNSATTSTVLNAAIFDMPSREKEDEELDDFIRNSNNKRNQNKFRLSNIVKRRAASKSPKESIIQVHSLQEYKTEVADVTDALVVVFFTAPWCRTCARLKPKMKAMANRLKGAKDVKLVQVPLLNKESAALFQGLGVKSFPFAHIYHPTEGLVEELKLKRQLWNEFQITLGEYREGSCELQFNKDGTIRHEMRIQLAPGDL